MTKKLLYASFISFLLIITPGIVVAQTIPSFTASPTIGAARNEFQVLNQNKSNEVTATYSAAATSSAQLLLDTIIKTADEYLQRLTLINQKIGTRIDKLKKAKAKTTKVATKYNNLNRLLPSAQKDLQKIQLSFSEFSSGKKSPNEYTLFQKSISNIQNNLNTILQNEKEIINDLAQLSNVAATPTAVINSR